MSIFDNFLDLIVPFDCLGCNNEGKLVCDACLNLLPQASPKELNGNELQKVHAASIYKGLAKDLIWKLKSSGAQASAKIMAELMSHAIHFDRNALIVPVPTASSRVRQRGYDQARLLAKELSRKTGLHYADCLARSGQAHQVGSDRSQRLQQLSNAFRVKKPLLVRNQRIILIDDVVTTGSTLEAAAKVLKNKGAQHIEAIVFAKPELRISV